MNRRPRLTLHGSSATPEEAAAVVAAIEQFLRDTAPRVGGPNSGPNSEEHVSAWARAALLEGAGLQPDAAHPWA